MSFFLLFLSSEASPGASLHRVLSAGLHLQREPHGYSEAAKLPAQRGPSVQLSRGPEMRLWGLSDPHH